MYAALFAYLAGSTFVLQDVYGLSPQWYAAASGLNSAGHMLVDYLAGRAAARLSISGTLAIGVIVTALGALGLLVAGLTPMPLWVIIVSAAPFVGVAGALSILTLGLVTVICVILAAAAGLLLRRTPTPTQTAADASAQPTQIP